MRQWEIVGPPAHSSQPWLVALVFLTVIVVITINIRGQIFITGHCKVL